MLSVSGAFFWSKEDATCSIGNWRNSMELTIDFVQHFPLKQILTNALAPRVKTQRRVLIMWMVTTAFALLDGMGSTVAPVSVE